MKLLLTLPLFLTTILGLSAPSRADATAPPPFTPDQAEAGAGPTRPRVSSAVWTSVARAASATPAASPSRPGTAGADTSATGRPTNPALDFDFFNAPSGQAAAEEASSPDERAAQARTRRWMLEVHQILGIATWAAMVATVTVGQLNYNQLYGGDGGSNKWQTPHQWLVISTSTLFAATGGFALLAPTPYPKPLRFDTGLVHRIAVAGATLGMVTEIFLGWITSHQADSGNPHNLRTMARYHQVIGYSTLGFLTVAGGVWIF